MKLSQKDGFFNFNHLAVTSREVERQEKVVIWTPFELTLYIIVKITYFNN